jgi:large subunit ribosomal protein L7/L12
MDKFETTEHPVSGIVEQLKVLTLIETTELVRSIEDTFGVDSSVPIGGIIIPSSSEGAAGGDSPRAAKTTFDVILESVAEDKRVASLKAIRRLTDLGLKEAKDFCSSLPKPVKEGISKDDAEIVKRELEKAGGTVRIS